MKHILITTPAITSPQKQAKHRLHGLVCAVFGVLISGTAFAKTEQITLKKSIEFGEEAVIVSTHKGEVILNYYALPDKVARKLDSYKKGQCLEVTSTYGFYQDTGDGSYIQRIEPCKAKPKSGLAKPKVN
ncbi:MULTISPECIES: hypothetical protein [Acinetobacter]|uniref:hypothetical protein n=1 Tax=Acinetobacter TaxID=469 RepID=UPI001D1853AA|nr:MULTISPECIES: hypothetical protein [Acinetobacter]